MKTNVYIDGFNFYYGCVKNTSYKWLDFRAFLAASYPRLTLNRIRYFTALVKSDITDQDRTNRQLIYIRALETIDHHSVHQGQFLRTQKNGELLHPRVPGVTRVRISAWEEKGSDVNIATYLMLDAFNDDFEQAIVLSNDSDLAEPIRLVQVERGLSVGVLSPHNASGKPSFHLQRIAAFYHQVDRSLLSTSQFPPRLADAQGRIITKPRSW